MSIFINIQERLFFLPGVADKSTARQAAPVPDSVTLFLNNKNSTKRCI